MSVPRLVYDDDCGFCTFAVSHALELGEFEAVGFSELAEDGDLRARLPDDYEECMHLVTDTAVYSCGEALEQVTKRTGAAGWWLTAAAKGLPKYPEARETLYHWAADRRALWGKFARRDSLSNGNGST